METVIFHVDVNSAFLSWSAAYRKEILLEDVDLRKVAAVVGGNEESRHGIVLAKSDIAKKYKIETGEPLQSARRKCPGLIVVPPDYSLYVQCSRALIELLKRYSGEVEQYSIDEAYVNMTGYQTQLGSPVEFAHYLKDKIKRELSFTVNIGVGSNKLMAKMAGEIKKPDMVHTLFPHEIKQKLWPMPVQELFYVGRASQKKLNSIGIRTIGELANTPLSVLKSIFKTAHGTLLHDFANGIDHSELILEQPHNKGYGNSKTLKKDVTNYHDAEMELLALSETVAARIRSDKVKISVVSISIRDFEFKQWGHQRKLREETDITNIIYKNACILLREVWDGNYPIRQLGVHTSLAKRSDYHQYNIFEGNMMDKWVQIDRAVDEIRKRYGEDSIIRACFLGSHIDHMSGGLDRERRTGITKPIC